MKVRNELNYQLFLQKTSGVHRKPMNAEMEQFDDICNGDMDAVRENINNLTDFLSRHLSDNPVQNARYHLTIMASAIAKACIQSGMGHDEAYTLADIYIRKADKCQIFEGIIAGTRPPAQKVYHTKSFSQEKPISDAYAVIDNDLARDNVENDLTAADLQDF